MASRLKNSEKTKLVEGYQAGESTTTLAEMYGCSQNTVIRTVKTLLPPEEYNALKAARNKGELLPPQETLDLTDSSKNEELDQEIEHINDLNVDTDQSRGQKRQVEETIDLELVEKGQFALDDADDFVDDSDEESSEEVDFDLSGDDDENLHSFHEVIPLTSSFNPEENQEVNCEVLSKDVLPGTVYMIVDRSAELESRSLSEFTELGSLPETEKDRQAISLFSNQRSAKRYCGRSQRVIKVPDSGVFGISAPFLLARGISRLVLDGSLISLDEGIT